MTFFFETFPMPPSINDYYGRRRSGGVYIKKEGKEFREKVVAKVIESYGDFPTFTEPVRVVVDIYPPDRRRRDADNILKALLDAIKHAGVYRDDCLVFELLVRKREPEPCEKSGRVVVSVGPLIE